MDTRDKRDLYNGFGNAFSRGCEFALTPAIFGAAGYGLDRILGIVPILTIVFLLVGLAGMFLRMWYGYDAEMKAHEARGAWAPKAGR